MYSHELPGMMPFLLRGIDLPEAEMKIGVIETLISVAEEESGRPALAGQSGGAGQNQKDVISEHAGTIVTNLLKNIEARENPSTVSIIAADPSSFIGPN